MPRFKVKQSSKLQLTSYSGLALIGQCCQAAQVEAVIDPKIPVSQGMRTSDIVKSVVGLLSLGKSDFEAIEPFREDRFFKESLGLTKVPGAVWLRQRLNAKAEAIRDLADELSLRLLERTEAPITPHKGYVCCDIDTFAMDNSGTKKEAVSRTYQGFDGYTPIAAYLGNEGWNTGLELRPGSRHSAFETHYFYERLFPRIERLVKPDQPVLLREDSGFDGAQLLFAKAAERDRQAALGRSLDFICKWNPRKQDKAAWVARAEDAGAFAETRPGKREALLSLDIERAWHKEKRSFRLVARVVERTIDKKGQHLLAPEVELEGGWTTLSCSAEEVIELYQHHGMHEQFHSDKFAGSEFGRCQAPVGAALRTSADQFKTDLDLERLPSGKFDTNDVILHLAAFAYNCLRLLGQIGLTGEIAPIRHPAKRRRIRTVLQEIMYRAAKFVAHARRLILDFGRGVAANVAVFVMLQNRLWAAASG
ncbi:IS1380 family transposase [Methylococcus sp. ANG]|uniref:IS1380 family transposase n=1 Tax=Methylococcus sp. ANG TaxID=3231903 RepID=UPI00345B46D4